jgi:decaprenyl-phosphate phosphoribosyltransferase
MEETDVLMDTQHQPNPRDLKEVLLNLEGVYSVRIGQGPGPEVEALFVRAVPGRSVEGTIAAIRAAVREQASVDVLASRIHIMERPASRTVSLLRDVLTTARPRQWAKNVLVFGAPATGGVLLEPAILRSASLAFIAFCLTASGVYFINDLVDAPVDRQHPTKRLRPVASGTISPRLARVFGVCLMLAGLVLAFATAGWELVGIVGLYVGLTLAYTFILRNIALFDLGGIAGGFILRAVAGGVATGVPLSMWFLMVAMFGSLFLAAGKRRAEYVHLGDDRASHRPSFRAYSEPYLRYIQYSASTVAMAAYAQWAFEGAAGGTLWSGLSIGPFVLGIFRYGLLLETGRGASPEDLVLTDPTLLVLGVAWVLFVAIGVYVA